MKYYLIIILTIFNQTSQADWFFNSTINNELILEELTFPVEFNHLICKLSFTTFNSFDGFKDYLVGENGACNNQHHVVIDGYAYTLPVDYTLYLGAINWEFVGPMNFGNCETVSGDPISISSPNVLFNGLLLSYDTNQPLQYVSNLGERYWILNSLNGDVICTNGIPFVIDLIFNGDFE